MPQPLRNPPTADVERIVKLVAERNNLKQHCRGLQASVLELQVWSISDDLEYRRC